VTWSAPFRNEAIYRTVRLPGSKSLTNRALVLAAIASSPGTIESGLVSRDTDLMVEALSVLGAQIDRHQEPRWRISPIDLSPTHVTIDCGLAGTVMRFVPIIAALGSGDVTFDGDERARERPMSGTISALRSLGVSVEDEDRGTLPFTVRGSGSVEGGTITIDASASSQFISAVLLAAPRFTHGVTLAHVGTSLPSTPHIDMTVTELRRRGVRVEVGDGTWTVHPGEIAGLDVTIEPDLSNAGPFIATAVATGGVLTTNWPAGTNQAGDAWRQIIPAFGGTVEEHGDQITFASSGHLRGADLDLHDVGELTPVVAALAALASTPSRLRGIAHLRGHETDRLAALVTEITALGGQAVETDDGLDITPTPLHQGVFHTYEDHRMAHAGVVLGSVVAGIEIENIETTAKTWPGFADFWATWLERDD
jgi:3-phosphoshikimate 1-carboxyvinyltransferase